MNFNNYGRAVFFALILVLGCACTTGNADGKEPDRAQTGLETRMLRIVTAAGELAVEAELARTERERETGLMFRTELEDGKGMLFIFEHDQVLSFWMKNTLIPLSIAYIAYDGTIVDIRDMRPRVLQPVQSTRSVRYALEVPRGWFTGAGVKTGDKVLNL
ncbi:MAG: DUF192 domain-containing protein [Spirochaetaceae bacterium]|jgi:uncharacterized membrane protein (UPF0127 family)|nr:DUF192 domain-containing protein [Spirochaetaceae bacterium]